MTGQDKILSMRRAGYSPRYVWVSDFPNAYMDGVTVRLAPSDVPEQQDFRFLVGLTALVEGQDDARVQRIAQACSKTAKRVIAATIPRLDVTSITDTEGALTWHS